MLKTLFYVALGGALGSVLRYLTSVWISKYWAHSFPLATFVVNFLGCLLIGLLMGFLERNQLSDSSLKWLLVTGFCGGYTTFSAFSYENFNLVQSNQLLLAFAYIVLSVAAGLLAVWLGFFLVR